ncbi:MAG: hypothetical protein JOZ72_01265 [Alphaproteobacteria bacterium]|nr:hypothetical protein [Alphaproteobacteria bacterium]
MLSSSDITAKLETLVAAYLQTIDPQFTAGLGDPLEIALFKILRLMRQQNRRCVFFGSFDLSCRNAAARYPKTEPTTDIAEVILDGPPDFLLFEPNSNEWAIVECKNVREWIYPSSALIKTLLAKALAANMTPILVARRLPFITKHALCAPAGIIAHETYNQLYPETPHGIEMAKLVQEKRGLGYFDVLASEEPSLRTIEFMTKHVPKLLPAATSKFQTNKKKLQAWVRGEISWTTLRLSLAGQYQEPDADMDF